MSRLDFLFKHRNKPFQTDVVLLTMGVNGELPRLIFPKTSRLLQVIINWN